ncbi:MAG: hypothetical protein AAF790_05670 [Planctomycetota bacterium]
MTPPVRIESSRILDWVRGHGLTGAEVSRLHDLLAADARDSAAFPSVFREPEINGRREPLWGACAVCGGSLRRDDGSDLQFRLHYFCADRPHGKPREIYVELNYATPKP